MISLTFPGRPVPWARVFRGKQGQGVTPEKQEAYRNDLALLLKVAAKGTKYEGPVRLACRFDFALSETILTIEPALTGSYIEGFDARGVPVGDVDNLGKIVMEAMQDIGIVKNDAQVASVEWEKVG